MKVVQLFLAIMTDRSRPARKIKLRFENFFSGNPGPDREPVTHGPGPKGFLSAPVFGISDSRISLKGSELAL